MHRADICNIISSNKFKIEIVRGQYQIFIATGDYSESTYTAIDINGQQKWMPDEIIKEGRFEAVVLPVMQQKDGIMEIGFSTNCECLWKVNMIIINRLL